MNNNLHKISSKLFDLASKKDFVGYDPFDGLNSKFFNLLPFLKNTLFGLIWIQFFKRSPFFFLRKIFFIPESRNPKGLALYILGTIYSLKIKYDEILLCKVIELADWLVENRSDRKIWKNSSWGYNFPWKARAFYVPLGKPNLITTVFVGRALLKLSEYMISINYQIDKAKKYELVSLDVNNFLLNDLLVINKDIKGNKKYFFSYIPGETTFVHNVNFWGAAYLALTYKHELEQLKKEKYRLIAIKTAENSISKQLKDGSWNYGQKNHHNFIDGFHTGYNLEALSIIKSELCYKEFNKNIEIGLSYYKTNFIEDSGSIKYFNNKTYPYDMHSVAQAVITLLTIENKNVNDEVKKIINKCLIDMYRKDTYNFIYQINKYYINKSNYDRWTQAWAYYSINYFLYKIKD